MTICNWITCISRKKMSVSTQPQNAGHVGSIPTQSAIYIIPQHFVNTLNDCSRVHQFIKHISAELSAQASEYHTLMVSSLILFMFLLFIQAHSHSGYGSQTDIYISPYRTCIYIYTKPLYIYIYVHTGLVKRNYMCLYIQNLYIYTYILGLYIYLYILIYIYIYIFSMAGILCCIIYYVYNIHDPVYTCIHR